MDVVEAATRGFEPETYAVIGVALQVHNELGPGFLEVVYHEAMARALDDAGIPFQHEVPLPIYFRGTALVTVYRADFLCYGRFIVELKAQSAIGRPEEAQVVNYLRASGLQVGLLLNFAGQSLHVRRLTASKPHSALPKFPDRGEDAQSSSVILPI